MRYHWLAPAGFFAASVYLWGVASNFRGAVGRYELIGPAFFPKILLAAIIGVSALALLRHFIARRQGGDTDTAAIHIGDLALAVAITIAYVAALHLVGFILATLAFQALMLGAVFRDRRWRIVCGVPVVLTTLFFVIFIELMGVPLPRGSGPFHQLNLLLY